MKLENLIKSRSEVFSRLKDEYFSLFLNNYRFKELDYRQNDYIFRMLWDTGKIACYVKNGVKKALEGNEKESEYMALGFADFIPHFYDEYNYPLDVQLLNPNASFLGMLPNKIMDVDEDVVIGYAQRSQSSVYRNVKFYLNKIVDFEMLINIQLILHKMPFLIKVTEENKARMEEIVKKLITDDPVIYCNITEENLIDALITGAPYILDKLISAKQFYENKLLTFLGIDNLGESEKKEHLVTAEIYSNNMLIKDYADNFIDCVKEFAERVNKVFGYKLTLECKSETYLNYMKENKIKKKGEENND